MSKIINSVFVILSFLIGFDGYGQTKYFIIDVTASDYQTHAYSLSTKAIYPVDKKVEIFNLIYQYGGKKELQTDVDQNLILFSVLPSFGDQPEWLEIGLDSLQEKLINFGQLKKLFSDHTFSQYDQCYGEQTKFYNVYKPIVKRGDSYFVGNNSLLQFYAIRNRPSIFNNPFGTINTQQEPISIVDFEQIFKNRYPNTVFPLFSLRQPVYTSGMDRLRDRREYLSKTLRTKDGATGYLFWTYLDWSTHTFQYDFERGIDRFVYVPGKGIIGGAFDSYFYFHRNQLKLKHAFFIDNIRNEKVMVADLDV